MQIKIFNIRIPDSSDDEAQLNQFIASHRVISVDKHFFATQQGLGWSFVVNYVLGDAAKTGKKPPTVDYKELLNETDFSRFAQLRELRNELAKAEGKPAYAIFSNEQLAAMVTGKVSSNSGMAAISGIGEAKLKQYAHPFLAVLHTFTGDI